MRIVAKVISWGIILGIYLPVMLTGLSEQSKHDLIPFILWMIGITVMFFHCFYIVCNNEMSNSQKENEK